MGDRLAQLKDRSPGTPLDWMTIGRILADLESASPASPDGRPWPDIMVEELEKFGEQMTIGHLGKIRRTYDFVSRHPDEGSSDVPEMPVPFSAAEIAARIFSIDRDEGLAALRDARNGTSFVDLRKRYQVLRASRPQSLSRRQVAWNVRKAESGSFASSAPVSRRSPTKASSSNSREERRRDVSSDRTSSTKLVSELRRQNDVMIQKLDALYGLVRSQSELIDAQKRLIEEAHDDRRTTFNVISIMLGDFRDLARASQKWRKESGSKASGGEDLKSDKPLKSW